jgi:hypothetical protein
MQKPATAAGFFLSYIQDSSFGEITVQFVAAISGLFSVAWKLF